MKKVWINGTVITMDPKVQGNAVAEVDGVVSAVGDAEELCKDADEVIDLKGHTIMPGLIDPHSHFTEVASGSMQADLDGASSVEEIGKRLQSFLSSHSIENGAWVQAKNYDTNLMPNKEDPTLEQLDSFTQHPLAIQQKSGHMGLFNSAALAYVGITIETPDPEGGKIGRKDGKLTGYLEENAYFIYMKKAPMASQKDFIAAYQYAQDLYASYGITTLQEGMVVEQMLPLYQMLMHAGILKLDLVSYPDLTTYDKMKEMFPQSANQYHDHMRIGGIKIFLDGSPQGRTAWMRTPYKGADDYYGYPTMKDEEVDAAVEKAGKAHVQLLAHCNGDAAAAQYIQSVSAYEKKDPSFAQLHPVIIHAQLLGTDQIAPAKELGMIASFFVAHVYHWGDVHIENFGLERASKISPAASAKKIGLPFTFHQDSPVIQPDMMETVWCAVNRITKNGILLGADERVSVYDALYAVTAGAAYQYGEEDHKGSITPGKQADLVIVDQDPLSIDTMDIRNIQILETIKNGETVFQKKI